MIYYPLSDNDVNVRKAVSHNVATSTDFYFERLSHISSYCRLCRVVARILKWVQRFRSKTRIVRDELSFIDLENARNSIVKIVQSSPHLSLNSASLKQLSPFVD